MKKLLFKLFLLLFFTSLCFAENKLFIGNSDLRLIYVPSDSSLKTANIDEDFSLISGFHLYIRKKEGIESVLLCETTKDPAGENDNYSYRALEYNPINGDEITYLNGEVLVSEYSKYRLADSTPEKDEKFGQAFHIYIPKEMIFGYPWTRNGKITIKKGTFINIRAFEKKYADYTGEFFDNPYMFDLQIPEEKEVIKEVAEVKEVVEEVKEDIAEVKDVEKEVVKEIEEVKETVEEVKEELPKEKIEEQKEEPKNEIVVPVLTDNYNPIAAASFTDIADFSEGQMVVSDLEKLSNDVMLSIERIRPKEIVDIVIALDATGSMKDDLKVLREEWLPSFEMALKRTFNPFGSVRIGLLLYRDYTDDYNYRKLPVKFFDFTDNIKTFRSNMHRFVIRGGEGGDVPEAVYEALYASLEFYNWRPEAKKKIILIGDAEPHPTPRGTKKYTKELISKLSKSKNVIIDTIIVPDNKKDRGR